MKETQQTKDQEDFLKLADIVASEFRVDTNELITNPKGGIYKIPRHVVAAIYSNWNTLQATADKLGYRNHQSVSYSRRRLQTLLNEGRYKKQLMSIVDQVEEQLPLMLP